MIASLPMYDTAETRSANDRLWDAVRLRLGRGPECLDRSGDPHMQWLDPDLLLSQTCSLPFRTELKSKVRLVGTPDYGVDGCPPGYYRSVIVVRADDPREHLLDFKGAVLARNDVRSQSGWAAIEQEATDQVDPFSFLDNVLDTGAHAKSAQAVAEGKADLAAIDSVTWALLVRDTDLSQSLRVLAQTKPTPGLPLITSLTEDPAVLYGAVRAAIDTLSKHDRDTLLIKGLIAIPEADYLGL